jgi:hypothetical protein
MQLTYFVLFYYIQLIHANIKYVNRVCIFRICILHPSFKPYHTNNIFFLILTTFLDYKLLFVLLKIIKFDLFQRFHKNVCIFLLCRNINNFYVVFLYFPLNIVVMELNVLVFSVYDGILHKFFLYYNYHKKNWWVFLHC